MQPATQQQTVGIVVKFSRVFGVHGSVFGWDLWDPQHWGVIALQGAASQHAVHSLLPTIHPCSSSVNSMKGKQQSVDLGVGRQEEQGSGFLVSGGTSRGAVGQSGLAGG